VDSIPLTACNAVLRNAMPLRALSFRYLLSVVFAGSNSA
jgi:hypothetical protein